MMTLAILALIPISTFLYADYMDSKSQYFSSLEVCFVQIIYIIFLFLIALITLLSLIQSL